MGLGYLMVGGGPADIGVVPWLREWVLYVGVLAGMLEEEERN